MAKLLRARIAELEEQSREQSAVLDMMAYRHPATYREVTDKNDGLLSWRPGVARLEMIAEMEKARG